MSQGPDPDEVVTVSDEGVTVEKTFVADEFPVPAVAFTIRSERSEPVDVRVTDAIPESFPMEHVGFHPDFENDNWTAYTDHRVEYSRTLEPGESVRTVYGVRLDDPAEGASFLGEPSVERIVDDGASEGVDGAESVEDVLGEDRTQVVREALAGDRDGSPAAASAIPGLSDSTDSDAANRADAADPLGAADSLDGAPDATDDDPSDVTDDGGSADADPIELPLDDPLAGVDAGVDADVGTDGDAATDGDAGTDGDVGTDEAGGVSETDPSVDVDSDDGSDVEELVLETPADEAESPVDTSAEGGEASGGETPTPRELSTDAVPAVTSRGADEADASGGIAAALAAEIREDRVDAADLALLKRELDAGDVDADGSSPPERVPASVDARIRHLQSKMDDLEAYSDALAEFLDEEGTGAEAIADLRERVEALAATVDGLSAELGDGDVREEVERLDGEVATLEAATETNAEAFERLDDEMGDVRADIADLDADLVGANEDLREELAAIRDEQATVREELAATREEGERVREELDAIEGELEEFREFRSSLGNLFGGA
ncbi:AAA family ATPase [Halegenticoccus soli]|uniref:hypothetical protein n=1 Tax=Halegenticoccus soli TaxID=1985678 RepID=UPI000C6CCBC2|nr:hypothetical protein [Halegenticoccus soli]